MPATSWHPGDACQPHSSTQKFRAGLELPGCWLAETSNHAEEMRAGHILARTGEFRAGHTPSL